MPFVTNALAYTLNTVCAELFCGKGDVRFVCTRMDTVIVALLLTIRYAVLSASASVCHTVKYT